MSNRGSTLVEAVLAMTVFVLAATAFVGAIIAGREAAMTSGMQARAVFLAEEGLEAVRNIRDAAFANLVNGTHGLAISGSQWVLSGSSDTTDIFTRAVTISITDADTRQILSTVTWQQTPQRPGSVSLTTYLTNWR